MANKIICIAREFGSGGHEIAVHTGARLASGFMKKICFTWHAGMGNFRKK